MHLCHRSEKVEACGHNSDPLHDNEEEVQEPLAFLLAIHLGLSDRLYRID